MDTKLIMEFERLKDRLRKAEEYEQMKYLSDAPENRERAEKALKQVLARMAELWNQMSLTVELSPNKSIDEWEQDIKTYAGRFLSPKKFIYYRISQRVSVRLEPPAYWWNTITRIINE
ncbi:MAG TPA: hypothetical protein VHP38_02130 [Ruminiclostridium sp.]|nr:hypothetical protein [Ruminiclostridium sp.]